MNLCSAKPDIRQFGLNMLQDDMQRMEYTPGQYYNFHPGSHVGQGLEIGFNNKYLMDALKAAPADKVRLELTTSVSPCVILPTEGEENFLYMVLPVRLRAGE